MAIDITFDFRTDTPPLKDPDTYSSTLGRYHRILWSKPLPNGAVFDLVDSRPPVYLTHRSEAGEEFWLSSDSVMHTYTLWPSMRHIIDQLPESGNEAFRTAAYTIGAMMVWPANRIGRRQTINQCRGFHPRIRDRFDLTVECVRRFYVGVPSPMRATLDLYVDFFNLFVDFRGFVDYFLLRDLVSDDYSQVKFFTSFNDFLGPAVPQDLDTYLGFRHRSLDFIAARNRRIADLGL